MNASGLITRRCIYNGLAIFTYPEMDISFVLEIYQLKETRKKKISADIINNASSASRTIRIRKKMYLDTDKTILRRHIASLYFYFEPNLAYQF